MTDLEIKQYCFDLGILQIKINHDKSVDVLSDVDLKDKDIKKLEVKFNKIHGDFDIRYNVNLTNTDNFPNIVQGNLFASYCGITKITDFSTEIGKSLDLSYNKLSNLKTKNDCLIGLNLYAEHNFIDDLEDTKMIVKESIHLSHNKLYDLYGLQKEINLLDVSNNEIESFADMPEKINILVIYNQYKDQESTENLKLNFYADFFNQDNLTESYRQYDACLKSDDYTKEQKLIIKESMQNIEKIKEIKSRLINISFSKKEEIMVADIIINKMSLLHDVDNSLNSRDNRKGFSDVNMFLSENYVLPPLPLENKPTKKEQQTIAKKSFKF